MRAAAPIREFDALAAKRIFVSHSHEEDAFGLHLVADLRRALGNGGDAWWAEIRSHAIKLGGR